MEAEEEAAKTLEQMGYIVLYRNLNVMYKKNTVCEFDIVLSNCIVEVKSGKSVFEKSKGFDFIVSRKMIPKNLLYYVYCKCKTNQEIQELHNEYNISNVIFINNLEEIRIRTPPQYRSCIIESQSLMARFLNLKMKEILKFKKIYISGETYDRIYIQLNYIRDSYSDIDNIKWSDKLKLLTDTNRLIICEEKYPENVIYLKKLYYEKVYNNKITLQELEPIDIPICYNITSMDRCNNIKDIYYNSKPVRYIK
jgi:hypothetical protein